MRNDYSQPLSKKQKEQINSYAKSVYDHADDEDLPPCIVDELYTIAYRQALIDIKKDMKKSLKDFINNEIKLLENL